MNNLKEFFWYYAAAFAAGVIVTVVLGFAWGGWYTAGGADKLAKDRSATAVVSALAPVCLANAQRDEAMAEKIAVIQAESTFRRNAAIIDTGWVDSTLARDVQRELASSCLDLLEEAKLIT